MFSFSDVYDLLLVAQNALIQNSNEISIILIANDNAGIPQTYALTIDNLNSFEQYVNDKLNSTELNGCTLTQKMRALNEELGEKFYADANYERAFLRHFADANISLAKANENLTDWNTLNINIINSNSLSSIPCN